MASVIHIKEEYYNYTLAEGFSDCGRMTFYLYVWPHSDCVYNMYSEIDSIK